MPITRTRQAVPTFLRRLGIGEAQWLYTAKGNLRYFCRPGHHLRVRVAALLTLHTDGYKRDLAVWSIKGDAPGDGPQIRPLFPAGIIHLLRRVEIEEFRASGVELSKDERDRRTVDKSHLRRTLAELETDDGIIVRCRCNRPPREVAESGLTFDEAKEKGYITPLAELPPRERQQAMSKVVIYKRATPNPAKPKALKRQDGDAEKGGQLSSLFANCDTPPGADLLPALLRRAHVTDAAAAAALASRQDVLAALAQCHEAREKMRAAEAAVIAAVKAAAAPVPDPTEPEQPEQNKPDEPDRRKELPKDPPDERKAPPQKPQPQAGAAAAAASGGDPEPWQVLEDRGFMLPAGPFATPTDELKAIIQSTTGRRPENDLVWRIEAAIEQRGATMAAYVQDIRPRLKRLHRPAGEGFYLREAKKLGGPAKAAAPEPKRQEPERPKDARGRCAQCHGTGHIFSGPKPTDEFCDCTMGRELARVQQWRARADAARATRAAPRAKKAGV